MFTNKVSGPGSSDNRAPSEHQDVSISRPTRYFPALLAQAQLTLKVSTKVLLLKERHSLSCSFIVYSLPPAPPSPPSPLPLLYSTIGSWNSKTRYTSSWHAPVSDEWCLLVDLPFPGEAPPGIADPASQSSHK